MSLLIDWTTIEQRFPDEEIKTGRTPRPDCAILFKDEQDVWHCRIYEAKFNDSSADEALRQIQTKKYADRFIEWLRNKDDKISLLKENVTCFGVYLDESMSVKVRSDKAV